MSKLFIQIQFLNAQKVYSYVHKDSSFHGVVYMESLTYSHFGKKYHTQKKKRPDRNETESHSACFLQAL